MLIEGKVSRGRRQGRRVPLAVAALAIGLASAALWRTIDVGRDAPRTGPAATGRAGGPPAASGPGFARLESPPPAPPPYVPRGYIPASTVRAPKPTSRPPLAGRPPPLPDLMVPPPKHNPGGVDGDRPPRPIPGLGR